MVKLKISITKDVLEESKYCWRKSNYNFCAIDKAVGDIFPYVATGPGNIILFDGPSEHAIRIGDIGLPRIAKEFIRIFDTSTPDQRAAMDPFSFEIEVPDSIIDTIDISQLINHPHLQLINS